MKKLVFFLNTGNKALSESHRFFYDIARYVAENTSYEVKFINDFCHYKSNSVEYIPITEFNVKDFNDSLFFTPVNYVCHLLSLLKESHGTRIYPISFCREEIDWMLANIGYKGKKEELGNIIFAKGKCLYNDASCLIAEPDDWNQVQFLPKFNIDLKCGICNYKFNTSEIRIAYLGELNKKIIYGLENIIADYLETEREENLVISIIGSSAWLRSGSSSKFCGKIRIIYKNKINDEEINEYLEKNVDALLTFDGESLKDAGYGIPTLLCSAFNEKQEKTKEKYSWIYNAMPGIFSRNEETETTWNGRAETFEEILNELYSEESRRTIIKKCHEYYFRETSGEGITEKINKFIEKGGIEAERFFACDFIKEIINKFYDYHNATGKSFNDFISHKNERATAEFLNKKDRLIKEQNKYFIKIQKSYKKKISDIRNEYNKSGKINVAFIVIFKNVFPARPVFETMLKDKKFNPYIIVVPNVSNNISEQKRLYTDTFESLKKDFGERVIDGYNTKTDVYNKVDEKFSVIFFSNPYNELVHPYHRITYFLNKKTLTLYVSYGFAALKFWEEVVKLDFYNQVWRVCVENQANFEHLKEIQTIKGMNGIVTGYVKMDGLALKAPKSKSRKNIIICPHHTVQNWDKLNISNFIKYSELFIELPKIFPEIDFIFRPHPLLVGNLEKHKIWTPKEIDSYFKRLLSSPNMTYDTSADYMQEFADSDAMIHDCGSFIGEYLYTMKPCLYMMKDREETYKNLLPFGKECMDNHYQAYCDDDIIKFIKEVVVKGNDPMKEKREEFVKNKIMVNYPNAAEETINIIKKALKI